MEADADRKPVPILCASLDHPALPFYRSNIVACGSLGEDPGFAALRRMRIEEEVESRLRQEEFDQELYGLFSEDS
jgi:hypothetical protein